MNSIINIIILNIIVFTKLFSKVVHGLSKVNSVIVNIKWLFLQVNFLKANY